jgi:hypothetical protein
MLNSSKKDVLISVLMSPVLNLKDVFQKAVLISVLMSPELDLLDLLGALQNIYRTCKQIDNEPVFQVFCHRLISVIIEFDTRPSKFVLRNVDKLCESATNDVLALLPSDKIPEIKENLQKIQDIAVMMAYKRPFGLITKDHFFKSQNLEWIVPFKKCIKDINDKGGGGDVTLLLNNTFLTEPLRKFYVELLFGEKQSSLEIAAKFTDIKNNILKQLQDIYISKEGAIETVLYHIEGKKRLSEVQKLYPNLLYKKCQSAFQKHLEDKEGRRLEENATKNFIEALKQLSLTFDRMSQEISTPSFVSNVQNSQSKEEEEKQR